MGLGENMNDEEKSEWFWFLLPVVMIFVMVLSTDVVMEHLQYPRIWWFVLGCEFMGMIYFIPKSVFNSILMVINKKKGR